jgi:hypothetical protein
MGKKLTLFYYAGCKAALSFRALLWFEEMEKLKMSDFENCFCILKIKFTGGN